MLSLESDWVKGLVSGIAGDCATPIEMYLLLLEEGIDSLRSLNFTACSFELEEEGIDDLRRKIKKSSS